jgi:chaperonin GroEL
MLEDIAVLTGGTFISEDTGRKLDSVEPEDCGRADSVRSDKDNTRIVGGAGTKQAIDARIAAIKREIDAPIVRLRRRKTPRTPGQIGRWSRRHQRRCRLRNRAQRAPRAR